MSIEKLTSELAASVEIATDSNDTVEDNRKKPRVAPYPQPTDEKGKDIPFDHAILVDSLVDPVSGLKWAAWKDTQFVDPMHFHESVERIQELELAETRSVISDLRALGGSTEERLAVMASRKQAEKTGKEIARTAMDQNIPTDILQQYIATLQASLAKREA